MKHEHTENPIPENLNDSITLLRRGITFGEATLANVEAGKSNLTAAEISQLKEQLASMKRDLEIVKALRRHTEIDGQPN